MATAGKERQDIGRAMSMAEAAPMLSSSPRGGGHHQHQHQPGSAFQDGDGAFDATGRTAGGATAASRGGGGAKAGRCVFGCNL